MHEPVDIPETSRHHPGWRVVLVTFVMALFGWGFGFYGHAIYLAELTRLRGWPASLVGGASTVSFLAGALMVAFVSDALARLGPRRLVLGAGLAMATAVSLLPLVETPWQLYGVALVMAVGWAGLGVGTITNLLGLWFREKRGLAISLALNGASSGGIVVAPILVFMTAGLGFGPAMWLGALVLLAVLVPLVLIGMPAAPPSGGAENRAAAVGPMRSSRARALRDPRFWSVCSPFALALAAQVGFIVHQVAFLEPLIGRGGAALAVAVTTGMAVGGRVALGLVIDRLDQRLAAAGSFASQALALAIMPFTDSAVLLIVCCAVFGFSVGNLITFPALIIQREFEAVSFGVLAALTTAVCQFVYAFGPGLLGVLRDASGDYRLPLIACAGLKVMATLIVLLPAPGSRLRR